LTPSYVPPVEVLSDPNSKYRHIAVTQVEVGDVVIEARIARVYVNFPCQAVRPIRLPAPA